MAVKLIANYSKRLGLPGYSSHQFTMAGLFRLRDRIKLGRLLLPAVVFLAMTAFVVIRSITAKPVPTLTGLASAAAILVPGFLLTHRSKS